MAICNSCEAYVQWVAMEPRLNAHPLDERPTLKGNIRLKGDRRSVAYVLKKAELAEARARGELLYTSHFATCPNAPEHRKKSAPSSRRSESEQATPPKPTAKPAESCVATTRGEGADPDRAAVRS